MICLIELIKWTVFMFHINWVLRWPCNVSTCLLFNSDFFFEKYEQEEENLSVWLLSLVISWCKHLLRNHFIKYSTCRLFAGLHNRCMYSVISLTLSTLCQSTPNHLKQVRNVSSDLMGEQRLFYGMFQRKPQSSSPGTMKMQTWAHGRHLALLASSLAEMMIIPGPQWLHV